MIPIPAAPDRRRRAEHNEKKREHPAEIELRPFAIRRRQRGERAEGLVPECRRGARAGRYLGADRGPNRT
jgi:hypothetical protein